MERIKKILGTRTGIFYSILALSTLVLGMSYGLFMIVTDKYNSSELLISNLMYGIEITSDTQNDASISGTTVTVPANESATYYVTVYSINNVSSKYTLGYKPTVNDTVDNTNIIVTGSKRSGWNTTSQDRSDTHVTRSSVLSQSSFS